MQNGSLWTASRVALSYHVPVYFGAAPTPPLSEIDYVCKYRTLTS